MSLTTWREEITYELETLGLTWADVVDCTLTDDRLDQTFDSGYGSKEGDPFTLWTAEWVLFPWCYDGSEGVASVPRNPCAIAQSHIGGG